MKAFTKLKYGGPEVLQLSEVEKPKPRDYQVLVKVQANSPNPVDWHILRGKPLLARLSFGLFKPKGKILGADFSGIVEEVGSEVKHFKVGDHVYGESLKGGAFAEYTVISEQACGKMPEGVGFPEMACVPVAGISAYQSVITHGKIKPGESVLVNGSSGGVGHFTIQVAKAMGAKVTGVCSSRNLDFVKSLGANHVIAYDREDIHKHKEKYNLVIDTHGNLTFNDFTRMGERGILVGFTTVGRMISVSLNNALSKFQLTIFTAKSNTRELEELSSLIKSNKVKVHIEKLFSYKEIPAAIGYIEAMRTRGKVAMVWDEKTS